MGEGPGQGTAARILEAAIAVIEREGIAAATTRAIAEEAGVNLALINYYYRSKDALFLTAMRFAWGNAEEDFRAYAEGREGTALERLEGLAVFLLDGMSRFPELTKAMLGLGPGVLFEGRPLARLNDFIRAALDAVRAEAGLPPEPLPAFHSAQFASALLYPLTDPQALLPAFGLALDGSGKRREYAARLVDTFRASLTS